MQSFDINEFIFKFRYPLLILFGGLILVVVGIFLIKGNFSGGTKVEVLSEQTATVSGKLITAEIAGEVVRPGVYKLPGGSRIDDLLIMSGGFSVDADRVWIDKYLNRAAKITDGQKVYIPQSGSLSANNGGGYQNVSSNISSDSNGLININSASLNELDKLPGIGQVYGQSIIEHRPYSTVEELLSKGALKKSLYDKIKNLVSVY